jgi:hypothetical protein
VTGQNSEQVPSPIVGATRLKVLLRSVEEIDRELDEIAADVPAARRDEALDLSSVARVDDLLSALHGPAVREDVMWSAPPLATASVEPPPTPQAEEQEAFASISFSDVPGTQEEEDVPRQLLDFEPPVAPSSALATIVDMPDVVVDDAPPPPPSAVDTVIVAPDDVPPLATPSDPPVVNDSLFLSEPPAMPVGDLGLEPAPELRLDDAGDGATPDLGAVVESMLIDEEAVVVEGVSEAAPPPASTERDAPEAPEEQVLVDSDEVLVLEAPTAVTGTLLGLAPTFRPGSLTPSKPPENDLGEIVFNLEPELEVAKAPSPLGAPASRPLVAASSPLRARDSSVGILAAKRPPPKPSDSLDNLELDLADFMSAEARPPSLRPPPLLRQPPPPPQRSVPPPVPRASKPTVESEEVVELDDQELEVMRASSRPPPGADSKAPPPVPHRPGGQK